jgi:thiamine biosynthesis protein ThiS
LKAQVNGRQIDLDRKATITDLVDSYKLKADSLIVSLNDRVISRKNWIDTDICEGDHIEFVAIVGGG